MTINELTDTSVLPSDVNPDYIVDLNVIRFFDLFDTTLSSGSGIFVGGDIVLSAGHVLLHDGGAPYQGASGGVDSYIFDFGRNILGANEVSFTIDSNIQSYVQNIGNWLGAASATQQGSDIAYARVNNGSSVINTAPSIIIFQDPNDASGQLFSVGYSGDFNLLTPFPIDSATPFFSTGNLNTDSYSNISGTDERVWAASLQASEGMSGSGVWLEFSDQINGVQGTYLAGILSAEGTSSGDDVTLIEPIGDVYWNLASSLSSSGYSADQFGTQVIVSSQSTGGPLIGTFFNEIIIGSAFDDELNGGGGDDQLFGGGGFDTAIFDGSLAEYSFSSDISGGIGLFHMPTGERAVLFDIERIQFADVLTDQFGNPVNSVSQGINLISGLGGSAGFGEQLLARNDDGSTGFINITSIFEDNINFFGREFDGLWVNNNGSVTFNGARATFTPDVITGISNNPEITPFFADVDTRGGQVSPTSGGNSTGSNLVYYDFDTVNDRFIVTWDDVGYFSNHTDKLNAFQLILTDRGSGDFDIEFRYEDVNWTTGDASGGSGGLGGTVARAGYTAGTGDPAAFFELPASGNQADMLALDETAGNTGDIGRWEFKVRSGDVVISNIPPLPPIRWTGWTTGDPHISTLDGIGYDFQAAGEFVMLRGVSDPSFEIQARMVPIGNNVSVNSAVATNLGGVAVMVDAQDAVPLQIDGIATTISNFSSINVGNDRVFREDNTYTIVYAGADGIVNAGDSRLIVNVFSNRVDIQVHLNDEMVGDVEGLMGDADSNPDNDIALADGTVLDRPLAFDILYGQYRDDWRVSDIADSLFTYDGGESLDGFYLPAYPSVLMTLNDLDPAVRAAAEQAVLNAGLPRGTANFNNAVLDFALTGDSSYIVSALDVPRISESNYIAVTPPAPNPPLSIHVIDNGVIDEGQVFTRTIAFTDGEDANADGWAYSVDWNDGSPVEAGSIAAGASSFNISRAFADGNASRTVSVTVTDVTGDSDTRQFVLDVNNVAPTIALAGAAQVNTGDSYALNLGAITDPGDDTVTSYIVNWGDGNVDIFNAAGEVAHVYAATGSNTIRVDLVDEDGTHVNAGNLAVSVNSPSPVEVVRIGDAPLRVSRSDPNAWENAWTDAKIDISHKADYLDPLENWSSAALNGNNSSVLNGGDIFGGDLGVSGQSLVSSTIRQEIDGTEALRLDLGETATKVTIDLSRLDGNSTTGHFDAGRLQLLDDAGTVVNEFTFSANALSSDQQITLEHGSGFSSAVLTAGVYNGADFIFGGLSDVNGQYLSGPQNQDNGTWNASEYLVDAVEFEFGNITLVGIAA